MDAQEAIIKHGLIVDDLIHISLTLLGFRLRKGFEGVRPLRIYEYYMRRKMSIDAAQARLEEYQDFWDKVAGGRLSGETLVKLAKIVNSDAARFMKLIEVAGGTLSQQLISAIMDRLAAKGSLDRKALQCQIDARRKELEGDGPVDGMEKMLIDRVVILWLEVHELDMRAMRLETAMLNKRINSHETVEHFDRRRETAERKLRQEIKALASMREQLNAVRRAAWPDRFFNSRMQNVYQSKN